MNYKFSILFAIVLSALLTACGGTKDPKKLFLESDLASTKIQTAKYSIILRVKTPQLIDSMSAKVWLKRDVQSPLGFRIRIETSDKGIMTYDGSRAINVDMSKNRAMLFQDPDNSMAQAMYFGQFFSQIMKKQSDSAAISQQKNLVYKGTENVNGAECYLVTQDISENDTLSNAFYFGAESKLIMKFVSKIISQKTEYETVVSGMEIDKTIEDNMFTQSIPSGFSIDTIKPGPAGADGGSAAPGQKSAEEEYNLLKQGSKAPDFSLSDPNGKSVSLKDFAGKVVVIDFWATWCRPCQMAMPLIQKVYQKYKNKNVVVIGISSNERGKANPAETMKKLGCNYMLLLNGEKITSSYNVPGFPTLYVIDKKGNICYSEVGYDQDLDKKIGDAIDKLIK